MRKRIALITTWFPPNSGVAVNRMRAFASYLSEDFELEVYTLGPINVVKHGNFKVFTLPSSQLMDILADKQSDGKLVHIFKVGTRIILKRILKDPLRNWKNGIEKELRKNHLAKPYHVVISSYSPVDAHEIAYCIKSNFPELKWIADMRDEMSLNPNLSSAERILLRKAEERFAPYIDALTTVSLPILKDFQRLVPQVPVFAEIRNGFDHSFYCTEEYKSSQFILGYFGTFYGKIKPDFLFSALVKLKQERAIDFKIRLVGVHANFSIPASLQNSIEILPPVSYEKAIEQMAESSCNLLLHPIGERKGVYTGKLFDYLSVERPIIACIDPTDVAADLIKLYDAGYVVSFDEVDKIKDVVWTAYTEWKENVSRYQSAYSVQDLHRKVQVYKLKDLILSLTK